jgi:hypothetical protein
MSGDGAQQGRADVDETTSIADESDVKLEQDFANAPSLSRGERRFFQRLFNVLQITDFMTAMMVVATFFSAYATWRTAQVTNLLFSVAERPYIGVERTWIDSMDANFARLVIDCRNFGQVQATGGVARVTVVIDGKRLPQTHGGLATENIGVVSPTVPHQIFRFIPIDIFNKVRDGEARMIVHTAFNYRSPDDREFCYSELMTYDRRLAGFVPSGGNDRCDGEIY